MVLVLDNCEHLIGATAELCAGLLAAADDVRVLATSREPLAVAGEARYRLGPLTLPGPDETGAGEGSEAVAPFADRARSADPRFALDEQTAAGVAELVARLDGMPLAIELAAARVEALGVGQLLDRLDDQFELLAGADRLAASRQRSLAATVEWSYQLLDETERRVFRAVSVFPGPFTLEAAEAVAGQDAAATVLRLVDCSLLIPPRACRPGLGKPVPRAGSMPRMPPCARCWPGRWAATGRRRCGWSARWAGGGGCGAGLAGQYPLLAELAGYAEPGSYRWCTVQFWAGWAAWLSSDPAGGLEVFTALRDAVAGRPPSRALADALTGRSPVLGCWAGTPRRSRMPAVPWPSPARRTIRSGR